ncbi:metallophosphatase [Adhaeribacter sp. BT258]|uniref:Metallophosphatase n=1 Tax=Adhaeribacter terrigena TaxID=2793070 RepID=A0ABS1BXU1_9BACT|nr:metallophosphatase [Adhaeribacter terrigena]MBK0401971.1 metallophosphatase [Adhaeribacter terrigena]
MKRREFLRNSLMGTAGLSLLGFPFAAQARPKNKKLVILHTNDTHSRIDPFPSDGRANGGMGGMARRASLIKQIRAKEKNVLLLDSGDIFQGTPYFNFFGGELEYKLMSQMGYDAATLGNHDFDNGLAGLQKQLPHASFPFLSANYDFSETILKDKFQPYKVFVKDELKIGVFGLGIDLQGLVGADMYGKTLYLDPVVKAKEMVKILRDEQECNLIICLSHLGYKYDTDKIDDRKLAAQVGGIDLILGGHTHTFLEKPDAIISPGGEETLINQVGWAGINLGRIDFEFSTEGKKKGYAAAVLPVHERTAISS